MVDRWAPDHGSGARFFMTFELVKPSVAPVGRHTVAPVREDCFRATHSRSVGRFVPARPLPLELNVFPGVVRCADPGARQVRLHADSVTDPADPDPGGGIRRVDFDHQATVGHRPEQGLTRLCPTGRGPATRHWISE